LARFCLLGVLGFSTLILVLLLWRKPSRLGHMCYVWAGRFFFFFSDFIHLWAMLTGAVGWEWLLGSDLRWFVRVAGFCVGVCYVKCGVVDFFSFRVVVGSWGFGFSIVR